MTEHGALHVLARNANEATLKIRHNASGLTDASQGHRQTQLALSNAGGTAQTQRAYLADNSGGATTDRATGASANLEKSLEQVKGQSQEIQSAVEKTTEALKIAETTNQQKLDEFVREATQIMSAIQSVKQADPAGARQMLVDRLTELGRRLDIDVAANLRQADGVLTQIASSLSAGGRQSTTTSSAGSAPPRSFNRGGGGRGGGGGGGGGRASKPRLPVAIPPQPGTGVDVNLPDGSTVKAPNETAAKAVRAAISQLGVPYVWGGTARGQGLDCSGLTMTSYGEAGLTIPRTAATQTVGAEVPSQDQLLPGDLVVWSGHVAMVVGNGQMIEAGDPVQIGPIRTTNAGQQFIGFYRPTG
ncbi:C40 family peptidase [Amycolatopsis anabasis]|uniref:C40 family peptidase n=1 Tax=Amycolatopsis anabasis TaxID=1840409 RepID=UPI0015D25F13|nr:C40 family peptidase [Amycolatopsis anabasis]